MGDQKFCSLLQVFVITLWMRNRMRMIQNHEAMHSVLREISGSNTVRLPVCVQKWSVQNVVRDARENLQVITIELTWNQGLQYGRPMCKLSGKSNPIQVLRFQWYITLQLCCCMEHFTVARIKTIKPNKHKIEHAQLKMYVQRVKLLKLYCFRSTANDDNGRNMFGERSVDRTTSVAWNDTS